MSTSAETNCLLEFTEDELLELTPEQFIEYVEAGMVPLAKPMYTPPAQTHLQRCSEWAHTHPNTMLAIILGACSAIVLIILLTH